MQILHHYLRTTVIATTSLVILITLGIQAFVGFVNEIRDIGSGSYGAWQAFIYVTASLPQDIYPLFPAAVLIGCLIGLGRLSAYSELIVMRSAGVSKIQITFSVMRTTILMLVVMTFVGEWISPMLKTYAINYKNQSKTGVASSQERYGVWLRDGDNFIYINQVTPSGQLNQIIRYEFKDQQLLSASRASLGIYEHGHWLFKDVHISTFSPKHISTHYLARQIWPVKFSPELISAAAIDTDQATLWDLHHYINYLTSSGLSANTYEFAFWKRIFQPLATLVMIGLGIPFIFGPLRTVTMGLRILVGVVIGFVFYTFNEFLGPFTLVYQVPPLWSAAAPILLFAIIDVVLWWRVQ